MQEAHAAHGGFANHGSNEDQHDVNFADVHVASTCRYNATNQHAKAQRTGCTTAMSDAVFTNPVAAYASSARLQLEKQTLFRDYPILMAMSCQLANPGDYLTEDFSGTPLLLVRQKNGDLSGFINACAHRGAPVAQGTGTR